MKKSQAESTTAKNLEEKFDRGEDVLDYFNARKARVIRPKSKETDVKAKFARERTRCDATLLTSDLLSRREMEFTVAELPQSGVVVQFENLEILLIPVRSSILRTWRNAKSSRTLTRSRRQSYLKLLAMAKVSRLSPLVD